MEDVQTLTHTKWDCKYHVVWIPKYRKKVVYGKLREYLGKVLKELAKQRESEILEGHLMGDHVHNIDLRPTEIRVIPSCRLYQG